jgi:hypothetical protein
LLCNTAGGEEPPGTLYFEINGRNISMACFIVPGTEAVVTTIVTKIIEKKEKKTDAEKLAQGVSVAEFNKEHFSSKLKRLNNLLWGGSGLLAFEHLWHGEIQPFFPFLTAASNPTDTAQMLHEMSTIGVSMALLVTAVWGVITYVTGKIENREDSAIDSVNKGVAK